MAEAAYLELPYPEASVIEADTLAEQTLMLASELPDRPLVLGGCCCSHVGAIEALSAGEECLAVVWIDAHGDLNTPATSPSGNTWGMPLRMVLDDGAVLAKHVALIGARNLDPPEVGVHRGSPASRPGTVRSSGRWKARTPSTSRSTPTSVEPGELSVFMPEPAGCSSTSSRRCCGTWLPGTGSRASASPGSSGTRRTSRSSCGSRRPWACNTAL